MNKKIIKLLAIMLILAGVLAAAGCNEAETSNSAEPQSKDTAAVETGSTKTVEADLSVPPPGSQATQEKWDTFTEEKKQESWDKYIESLAAETGTDAGTAAENTQTSTVKTVTTEKAVSVVTALLKDSPMEVYYYGIGEVEAGKTLKVFPAVSSTAATVYVAEGDYVEAGDLLFALDSREWVKDLERAEEKWNAELELAQIRLNEATQDFERTKTFFDRDLVTRQELEKVEQTVSEAQVNLEKIQISRKTELEGLQENYKSRLGVSPGRGYVSAVSFSEGEAINSADFVEIVNLEDVQLIIEVPENIIPRITRGSAVLAKTPSSARYGMEGAVTGYSIIPENNRTYKVTASLVNRNQRLFPGMLMEAQIRISQLQPKFIVPRVSVITEGNDSFIFIIEDNVSVKVPVEQGTGRQGYIQVEGDLYTDALLVIEGQSYLKQGTPVNIVDTQTYLPDRTEL